MSCPACTSCNQVEFSVEMIVHHGGLKNLDNSGVVLFPKVLVCAAYSAKWTTDDGGSGLMATPSRGHGSSADPKL